MLFISNYAELLTALRWLYCRKPDVFAKFGLDWNALLDHFKIDMAKSIASFHVALTVPESVVRAYVKLIRYTSSFIFMTGLDPTRSVSALSI